MSMKNEDEKKATFISNHCILEFFEIPLTAIETAAVSKSLYIIIF